MTGYGRGLAERDGHRVAVEIRSVNHRFLDLKVRGVSTDPQLEDRLSTRIRKQISRGSVTVTVRTESSSPASSVQVDLAAARRAHRTLRELADTLNLSREVGLALLCQQPGVLVTVEESARREEFIETAGAAAELALEALVKMREAEGTALAGDIGGRIRRLGELAGSLGELARTAPEDAQTRLKERLGRLLQKADVEVDEARLAQEVALLADRLDVTEELVRIKSHLDQLATLLKTAVDPIGRRLDFLVQELGREFNTISSKSQSAEIASTVVEVKSELEKIREQVQNIE